MNEKKEIAEEIFSPVIKKFDRIKIIPHYKDECWSIDLIDRSSLLKNIKNYKFNFTIIDNHTKYAWAIPLKDKSGRSTTTALKFLSKKQKENRIKYGQIEVKSFIIKRFWIFLNRMKYKFIQLTQI